MSLKETFRGIQSPAEILVQSHPNGKAVVMLHGYKTLAKVEAAFSSDQVWMICEPPEGEPFGHEFDIRDVWFVRTEDPYDTEIGNRDKNPDAIAAFQCADADIPTSKPHSLLPAQPTIARQSQSLDAMLSNIIGLNR